MQFERVRPIDFLWISPAFQSQLACVLQLRTYVGAFIAWAIDHKATKKGTYLDRHERTDVVAYHMEYLVKTQNMRGIHLPSPPSSDEGAVTRNHGKKNFQHVMKVSDGLGLQETNPKKLA